MTFRAKVEIGLALLLLGKGKHSHPQEQEQDEGIDWDQMDRKQKNRYHEWVQNHPNEPINWEEILNG